MHADRSHEDLNELLTPPPRRRAIRWVALLAILAGVLVAFGVLRGKAGSDAEPRFRTAPAAVGDLIETVTATGTLSALDTVEVGAEVSGRILQVHVDFNDRVKAGQPLATLEPDQASARVEQGAAQLSSARASVTRTEATRVEAKANLERTRRLHEEGLLTRADLDAAEATASRAEAEVASARAQAQSAEATLSQQRSDLGKTVIRSPIDGIVLSRAVEQGQTVAASFQTPVLFTLARDLAAMRLEVAVDEADVGKVRDSQAASFTVDAYPGREFPSRVVSLRNVATTVNDVVTYETVLAVENPDLALRPGMTATASIVVAEQHDVLLVPNAALRFTPPEVAAAEQPRRRGLFIPGVTRGGPFGGPPRQGQGGGRSGSGSGAGAAPGGAGAGASGERGATGAPAGARAGGNATGRPESSGEAGPGGGFEGRRGEGAGRPGTVWVLRAGEPVRVEVATGASDGTRTVVTSPELAAGAEVIVDVLAPAKAGA